MTQQNMNIPAAETIEVEGYEKVLTMHDPATGYRGIIAIHNTKLGPAIGGTRFWNYQSDDEALADVLRLARGMTYKNAAAGLPFGGGKAVIIGDARTETARLQEKFDVIVLDAFSGDSPPFHLLTREAFADLKKCLAPNGLVVANIVGGLQGNAAKLVSSVAMTLESEFGKTQENPAPFTMKTSEEIRKLNYIEAVFASRVELRREGAMILTDAYAPLEAWSDDAVQAMRY